MAKKKKQKPIEEAPVKKANPVGHPPDYKPEFCEMLIEHMRQGLSYESFAGLDEVDVCIKTLYNWERQFPEFLQAKERAKPKSQLWWETTGKNNIISMPGVSLNATVYRMNMINRFGWKDKAEDDKKIQIGLENLSDDELDKKIKELEAKDE
jgi:hypothetical protein